MKLHFCFTPPSLGELVPAAPGNEYTSQLQQEKGFRERVVEADLQLGVYLPPQGPSPHTVLDAYSLPPETPQLPSHPGTIRVLCGHLPQNHFGSASYKMRVPELHL